MNLIPVLYEYVKINYFFIFLIASIVLAALAPLIGKKASFSPKIFLIGIIGLGLFLRLAWFGFSTHEPRTQWETHLIENDLVNIHAIELTQGKWFLDENGVPSGRRPIGYPLFLGLLYGIFGIKVFVVWAAQLFLSLVTIYLIYLLGKYIFPTLVILSPEGAKDPRDSSPLAPASPVPRTQNDAIGLLSAFFFAIYPVAIYSVKLITDEHLLLPVWYFGIFLLLREIRGKPLWGDWIWYGLIFGYATMIRTHTIFMPIVVGLVFFLLKRSWKKLISAAILTGFMMQLINLPWVIRNYKVWGVPVLYTATACFVYAHVNSTALPVEGEGHVPVPGDPGFNDELEAARFSGNEGLTHQLCGREMIRWIATHPYEFTVIGLRKLLTFMSWNRKGGVWPLYYQYYEDHARKPLSEAQQEFFQDAGFIGYYVILFLSLFSIAPLVRNWRKFPRENQIGILILTSLLFFWFAEHMVIYAYRKYRYPIEPLMMILSAFFLQRISQIRWTEFSLLIKRAK